MKERLVTCRSPIRDQDGSSIVKTGIVPVILIDSLEDCPTHGDWFGLAPSQ
jgi:hypothetical protein